MKSPIDIVRGRIVDIDKHGIVTIKARYDDWPMLLKREYKECNIQMIDSRPLSDKQRRTCYKLIREISNYTGMGLDPTKEYMKLKFIAEDLQVLPEQRPYEPCVCVPAVFGAVHPRLGHSVQLLSARFRG